MKYATAGAQREYLLRWRHVGPRLEAERHATLRGMTEQEYLDVMEQLWSVSVRPVRRTSSGLIKWHRMFHQ